MSYENGKEANMYIGKCIEAYKENPMVFDKVTQLTIIFMQRSDWPYSIVDLNFMGEKIMNTRIISIIDFCEKYLNDKNIIWDNDVPVNFRNDLEIFYLSVGQIFKQHWNSAPMKLNSIIELNDYHNPQILRFIRNDGKFMEFEMGNKEIEKTIQLLKEHLMR